ncbi:MAG: CCA tRNA nucleotidyltransferase [Clostridiales bacterium]|nr:CCA tRNA nucleotidyltransferase [Clostridiales bacterium]
MIFGFEKELNELGELFRQRGGRLFVVGGRVRNTLLGLPVSDTDITSALRPDVVISLCENAGYRVVLKGIAFGMVEIHAGDKVYEHTTFRSDCYAEGGAHRPDSVRFSDSPNVDAFRRDFTVNALYADVLTGEIVDPTGGLDDLKRRVIRAATKDPRDILGDDGLRIMRLCRFAAELGFDIEEGTLEAAKECAGLLKDISAERIRDELKKILLSDVKYGLPSDDSVLRGLTLLDGIGALDVILPELAACRGVEQSKKYHRYPVLEHMERTTAMSEPNLTLRLACLFHDVAKPIQLENQGNMHGHDRVGADITRGILTRLRFDTKTVDDAVWLVARHMFDLDGFAKDSTLKTRFVHWGRERSYALSLIRDADFRGSVGERIPVKTADRWRSVLAEMVEKNTPFSEKELDVTGEEIMERLGIPPSPKIGEIKKALLAHTAVRPQDNTKEKLLSIAKDVLK